MPVRTIQPRTSLSAILPEVTYTRSRLKAHPLGAPFVGAFVELRAEWNAVHEKELALRDAIVDAQAMVDHLDDHLDLFVGRVVNAILTITDGDRNHPLYKDVKPHADGFYHCPFENDANEECTHKPEKLKCNYEYVEEPNLFLHRY